MAFQLVMRSGPTPGAVYPLEGDQLTIGRDSTNGVAINDPEVSRRHARLTFQGGKYVLEDLGSTNGSFVNGQRLSGPHVLKAGDVVAFGEQIVLMYDAVNIDPGATIASPRNAVRMAPMPSPVQAPVAAPPPAQNYAGQVPGAYVPPQKKNNMVLILIIIGVLILICLCVALLIYIDADPTGARWCTILPFLSACQ